MRWLRIFDLPFEQTNHICNPWNNNRPVKFSRDGQPVPVNVGAQLIHLFDIGVMEFGQGSAILRKPISMGQGVIAVQKLFIDGRFVPATDIQTAQSLIALEQSQQTQQSSSNSNKYQQSNGHYRNNNNGHHGRYNGRYNRYNNNHRSKYDHRHQAQQPNNQSSMINGAEAANALNSLVANLQKQAAANPGANILDEVTINAVAKLLGATQQQQSTDDGHHAKRHRDRDRDRDRERDRDRHRRHRDHSRDRDRRHRSSERRHRRRRSRSRSRSRSKERSSDRYKKRSHRDSSSDKDRKRRKRRDKDNRDKINVDDNAKDNVINSLWAQIQLQQMQLQQSGLYNLNAEQQNGTSAYPSNRGGVY